MVSDDDRPRLEPEAASLGSPASAGRSPSPLTPDDSETRSAWARDAAGARPPASTAPLVTTFAPGQIVADRFRIVRFIARGGMGELYEAEDRELREQVALKTIRPEIARNDQAIKRFRREVQLARQVTHPNVCRIFDVFHHRVPTAEGAGHADDVLFVTMELLAGETLAERLRREKRIAPAAAFPLVEQMAAALTAAHQAGVVHRDFKSSNVILLPATPNGDGRRVVVTDFGLARRSAGDDEAAVTRTGESWGTPTYMAPEQIDGSEITPATDVYALGVVMFEMVTGVCPFVGDTPLSTAVKRLHEPPPSPRTIVPDLDADWEATILRCLARQPADRFHTAADIVKTLSGTAGGASRKLVERVAVGAAVLVLLALAAGFLARASWMFPSAPVVDTLPAGARVTARRSVAVLGFKNLSGRPEAAWISTALSEMLTTELAAGEKLRVIPGENVGRMKLDLVLADADSFASDTLARIRANLGSDLIVLGSYVAVGRQIRLDLRLQDAVAGETIAAVADSAAEVELLDLVSRTGSRLRERLGIEGLSAAAATQVRASVPSSPEAARLYAEGLAKLRLSDALAARELLEKAVAADPEQPLARSALSAAWSALGYDGRAREQARRAFELSGKLSREERLWIEGRYREATNEREKAVEIHRRLFDFFADNVDYGLRLAAAQTSGVAKDALATLDALRRLPSPASDDPRIDLAEAAAAGALSDFKRQQRAAARAAEKGLAQGARLLVARARLSEGDALDDLGDPKKGIAASEEARKIFAAAGDNGGAARALNNIAVMLRRQGDLVQAARMYEQALATYVQIGDRNDAALSLNNIANVLRQQGDSVGAQRRYEQALEIFREIGDKRGAALALSNIGIVLRQRGALSAALGVYREALAIRLEIGEKDGAAATQNNIGNVLSDQGDLAGARKIYEDAVATWRAIGEKRGIATGLNNLAFVLWRQGELVAANNAYGEALMISRAADDKRGVARTLNNLADVQASRGDLAGGKKMYEEALAIFREVGEKRGLAYVHSGLGKILSAEGLLAEATKQHQEALAIRQQIGEKATIPESRVAFAEIAVDQGRFAEGEGLARPAAEQLAAQKLFDRAAPAYAVLARARLAQGKIAGAQQAIDQATTFSGKIGDRFVVLSVMIAAARVRAASGQPTAAIKSLEATAGEATAIGFVELQLRAQLALGELEIRSGNAAAGRARLETVEREATARGFGLIARDAAAAKM